MIAAIILSAGVGAGIQGNPVCLPVTAQPGHSYPLGQVYIQDTGDSSENMSVSAAPIWKGQAGYGHAIPVDPGWISVSYPSVLWVIHRSYVQVAAGQGAYLSVTLNVPSNARPGRYAGNMVASTGGASASSGGMTAGLGAAATTDLEFAVGVTAPSCDENTSPSPSAVAASARARAAGDMVDAPSSSSAKSGSNLGPAVAVVGVIGVILVVAGRRR
jgi:hypothetical protein